MPSRARRYIGTGIAFDSRALVPGEVFVASPAGSPPSVKFHVTSLPEPGVPNVKINLYKEDIAPDGAKSLKLVDTTTTTRTIPVAMAPTRLIAMRSCHPGSWRRLW